MRNKRNIRYDYNFSEKRIKRRRFRERGSRWNMGFTAFVVLIIALLFGLGAFSIVKEILKDKDGTKHIQENLRKQTEELEVVETTEQTVETEDTSQTDNTAQTQTIQTSETDQSDETIQIEVGQIDQNGIINETKEEDNLEEVNPELEEVIPNDVDNRIPVKVRGIYVTGPRAGTDKYIQELVSLVDSTELNAMVIDIKNDSGEITYKMDLPTVKEIGAGVNYISNIKQLITDLKEKDIYLIARIVAFKDPILAAERPELSLKKKDGTTFRDKDGLSWVNPYKKEVWEYLVDVAKVAVKLGFDEIQFDYIRFSTDSGMKDVDFGDEAKKHTKIEMITEFTKYASNELKPLGVFVSADVYGAIIDSKVDADIVGQNYVDMSKYLDYICPMIYPSHYADGAYGIEYPDLEPYNLILKALNKSKVVLKEIDEDKNKAVVRPWLQDFTASWLANYKTYGTEEIRAQIQAVYDAGYEEWILWNGYNNYTKEGLLVN